MPHQESCGHLRHSSLFRPVRRRNLQRMSLSHPRSHSCRDVGLCGEHGFLRHCWRRIGLLQFVVLRHVEANVGRLQRVQNYRWSLATHWPDHIKPVLAQLRIGYLQRAHRSTFQVKLREPTFQTVTGRCSFRYLAVKTWNSLTETRTIDTFEYFRRQMKTISFRLSYSI